MKNKSNDIASEPEVCPSDNPGKNASSKKDDSILNRGQFRQYQINTRYKQIQTELLVSLILVGSTCTVFWGQAPMGVLLSWATSVITMVGVRSLFIYHRSDGDNPEEIIAWGDLYNTCVALSGLCWGSLGVISYLYGLETTYQFTMFILVCISLTAYISMQSSPQAIIAFVLPVLVPGALWLLIQGEPVMSTIGVITLVIFWLMVASSRIMRDVLLKSLSLSTHNTELIHKLVAARESAEKATQYAETINVRLQNEIRERQRAEEQIKATNREMGAILDNMQDTVYQIDEDGKILWTTPSVEDILGRSKEEVLNENIKDFYLDEQDFHHFKQRLYENNGVLHNFVTQLVNKDGNSIWISENCHYQYNDDREVIGLEGSIRDITRLREMQDSLHTEKENAQVTLGSIVDGVIRTDASGIVEYMNGTAEKGVGLKLEDCIGKPLMEIFNIVDEKSLKSPPDPTGTAVEEGKSIMLPGYLKLIHPFHNEGLSVEVIASPIRDSSSDITGVVVVFHDVTKSRSLSKMTYQATHDSLTGLINRREFENRVSQALDNSRCKDEKYALCYLDLDNFKIVNDTCGHTAGDELLKQLTTKLSSIVRDSDSLARLGGDEFGILLNGSSSEWAQEFVERACAIVQDFRFVWNNQVFRTGVSIGLVNINEDSGTMSDILSAADSACYLAKENGGNRIHKCDNDDQVLVERQGQMQWVQKIHEVLEDNRFRLFFQRIEKLSSKARVNDKIHGEVLLRMLDEDMQLIGPGSFIPAAERYNLMPDIDRWVVENTFRFLSGNMDKLYDRVDKCCINLSGQSLSDDRVMSFIIDQIYESKIPPHMLCFEITETAVIANLNTASGMIARLRKMGCRFALDDFGVGLSSFAYLSSLAVDYLKIDGSFVRNMLKSNTDLEMVRAINQIGHTMNVMTIAEFVEDDEMLQVTRDIGVDYAQGYSITKPVPLELALLKDAEDKSEDDSPPENADCMKASSGDT
jgi:diguanylate cyclase (GGDEF)-like protein/PAS domain S-box-containing protein